MQDLLNPGNVFPAQPSPHASCVVRFQGDVWAFLSYHSILPQKQEPGNLQLCRIVISGVKNSKQMSTTCLGSRPFSWADLGGWRAAPFLTKGLQEEKHPECRRVTARVRSCSPVPQRARIKCSGWERIPSLRSFPESWMDSHRVALVTSQTLGFYGGFSKSLLLSHLPWIY